MKQKVIDVLICGTLGLCFTEELYKCLLSGLVCANGLGAPIDGVYLYDLIQDALRWLATRLGEL